MLKLILAAIIMVALVPLGVAALAKNDEELIQSKRNR